MFSIELQWHRLIRCSRWICRESATFACSWWYTAAAQAASSHYIRRSAFTTLGTFLLWPLPHAAAQSQCLLVTLAWILAKKSPRPCTISRPSPQTFSRAVAVICPLHAGRHYQAGWRRVTDAPFSRRLLLLQSAPVTWTN